MVTRGWRCWAQSCSGTALSVSRLQTQSAVILYTEASCGEGVAFVRLASVRKGVDA